MTPLGAFFMSIYRVFLRVFSRAGYSRFMAFALHPRRSLGGAGGPAAPVGGGPGDATLPRVNFVSRVPFMGLMAPLFKGGRGGSHRSLLDLPVRTDTNHVVSCPVCGMPVKACRCFPRRDGGAYRPGGVC